MKTMTKTREEMTVTSLLDIVDAFLVSIELPNSGQALVCSVWLFLCLDDVERNTHGIILLCVAREW